jgi:hypothetical protein
MTVIWLVVWVVANLIGATRHCTWTRSIGGTAPLLLSLALGINRPQAIGRRAKRKEER